MAAEFEQIFGRLRLILEKHVDSLGVKEDSADCYSLDAPIGPATLRAWHGKAKTDRMPVAWVQIGKAYVSFHVMALYANPLCKTMSKALQARMQGRTCFNFKKGDEALFAELEDITARGIADFRKAGFIV
ncbi:MAG TPA: hypothetical protein VI282_18035 [Verrucomicrobiae bacterium]|jgi:hypothetical protein